MTDGGRRRSVVLAISSFLPVEGGAERQLREVLDRLPTDRWDVTVVALPAEGAPADEVVGNLRVRRVGVRGTSARSKAVTFARMTGAVRRAEPDVVVTSQLGVPTFAAWLATRLPRRPLVLRLAGGTPAGSELELRGRSRMQRAALRRLLRASAAVVSPARHLLARPGPFAAELAPRARLVANGTPGPGRHAPDGTDAADVVWIGRDHAVKGVAALLAVARGCPALRFVAVGLDDAAEAPANLRCAGRLDDVRPVVAGARVLLTTSAFEGSPNVVLEALALGVPAVGFDIAGLAELNDDYGRAVQVVPFGDVDALAELTRSTAAAPPPVERRPPTYDDAAAAWDDLLSAVVRND